MEEQKNTAQNLSNQIESILFYKGEPVSVKFLSQKLNRDKEEILAGVEILKNDLANRGISLVQKDEEFLLVTAPQQSQLIESIRKEELSKDLSKAALETLTIILYRGPIRRSEIDYIRGVNSQFSLRLLLIRGLIEKKTDPKDERTYLYSPSFDLLNHLGIQNIKEAPDYDKVNTEVEHFLKQKEENEG